MKRLHWFLLISSAVAYALPFLFSDQLWGLSIISFVPFLYLTTIIDLSFIQAYIWGCLTFALHMAGGVQLLISMAHEHWLIGILLGIAMVLYHALYPAFIFWIAGLIARVCCIKSPIARLWLWTAALWFFIVWTDWYSMWAFGIQEGYPLMHPLILLVKKPALLCLLPIVGKQVLSMLFLLVPFSCVILIHKKNLWAFLLFCTAFFPWIFFLWAGESPIQLPCWLSQIKSLSYMAHSTAKTPEVMVKVVGQQLKKIVTSFSAAEVIIMPESAFNVSNFAELPELLQLWNDNVLGKKVHIIFGASRWHNGNYYNSLHWVYNGVLQECCDKRHAMLVSERLFPWSDMGGFVQQAYFKQSLPIAISSCEHIKLPLFDNVEFVPYICSELFCNELPDDNYTDLPIIAVVNDSLFAPYITKLLVLLAQFKAIKWQREIVYVSYVYSLFISRQGMVKNINE